MRYYTTPLRALYDTVEPDLPEDIPISWVHYAANFAVVEVPDSILLEGQGVSRIKGNLEALLASTICYPPARALAAKELEDSTLAWPEFAARFEQILSGHFNNQGASGFQLVRCLKDQGDSLEMMGYGGVGHFYWALAVDGGRVAWVSDEDYMIHWAPVEEFDLPADSSLPESLP